MLKDLMAIALSSGAGAAIGWLICNVEGVRWSLAVIAGIVMVHWLSVRIGIWLGYPHD